jgi:hypothetical protein
MVLSYKHRDNFTFTITSGSLSIAKDSEIKEFKWNAHVDRMAETRNVQLYKIHHLGNREDEKIIFKCVLGVQIF